MAELPEGITQADLDKYAKLDKGMKKLAPEHKRLNQLIKDTFLKVGTFVHGDVIVDRSQADSFDKKAAEEDLPYEKFPDLYTHTIDPTKLTKTQKAKYTSKVQRLSIKVSD